MTDVIEVNCVTGCVKRRKATPAEREQAQKDRAAVAELEREEKQKEEKRQAILSKVAEATGVTVSELKDALRS